MILKVLLVLTSVCLVKTFTIGGIFYENSLDLLEGFQLCAAKYNFTTRIKTVTNDVSVMDINRLTCDLARLEVIGIIDGIGGRSSEHIQALCDNLELPHVVIQHNYLYSSNWTFLNLYPSAETFNNVLSQLIIVKEWNNFTILYTKGYSMNRVSSLIAMGNDTDRYTVTVRELRGNDYRDVLINAKDNGYVNFVVDCPSENLELLLMHAQQVGLMSDEHSYIFVSPDLFTLDLNRYRYGGANITGLRLTNHNIIEELWNLTSSLNERLYTEISSENLKTKLLLLCDAVLVFYKATENMMNDEGESTLKPKILQCESFDSWQNGVTLLNFMKTNEINYGLTRTLSFDGFGQRTNVIFNVLELTPAGNQSIGTWDHNILKIARPFETADIEEDSMMRNKTFKVLIAETAPYGFVKESTEQLEGNDRYEGFTVDLIDKIADMLGFNYELEVENVYGNLVDKKWTGMVAKIREDRADFGICDFTITAERQSGIDFSVPFMNLGISILYKEPSKQPPAMFSFMAVFSQEVWYYMMLVQFGVGAVLIFVSRISHKEWQNPVPCVEQPEELTNQFSFANSMWLIIGSVMQQGSEIAPIALAPRTITSVWWFFTMVMVASYVGTLVAFLTVEKNVMPFDTAEELYKQKSIAYGAKREGSTPLFFKDSSNPIYKAMYDKMVANNWLVSKSSEGVAKTESGGYAFFMESTSIAYETERHCDLLQVGGLLDTKSYGIGMKKESKYKKYIDDAILKLKEKNEISKLYDIWWKEKRGGGKCGEKRNEEQKQLSMKNIQGAFVVLGVGCLIGLLISTLDMLWGVFKRSIKYKTAFKSELIEELKFFIQFSGDVKPVKRLPKVDGSIEALAKAEGKDEVRSLRSLKSGTSTGTHRTHHSHSSKHSGLSIAFAKRREYS